MNALVVGGANHTLTRSEIHISHVLSTVIRVHSDRTATGFAVALAQDALPPAIDGKGLVALLEVG